MSRPEISVVIPAYRAEKTISRALQSIREEARVALEIIVVVDGEFDRTAEIARSFHGVEVITRAERRGVSFTRNEGLAKASAPFVHFFDADDYVEGDFHGGMVEALASNGADMVVAPCVDEYERPLRRPRSHSTEPFAHSGSNRDRLVTAGLDSMLMTGMCGWRVEALRQIGGWNEAMSRAEDTELFMRACIAGMHVTTANSGTYVYVRHRGERMTSKSTAFALDSYRTLLKTIEDFAMTSLAAGKIRQRIALKYYELSQSCFAEGLEEDGRAMFAEAARLGLKHNPGGLLHRLGCRTIGHRNTERMRLGFKRVKLRIRDLQVRVMGDRAASRDARFDPNSAGLHE